ncbi:MAG: hypothetical protein SWQ30_22075 [Thermodesulfobacteriota bacterium]|nr:hypothetical protein [Thermodesulfobacteriota bacterium]
MGRFRLPDGVLRIVVFLLFALLSISLTMAQAYANSDAGGGKSDMATETLRRHINLMAGRFPGLDEKKGQVEEQLANGKMPHEACSNCHIKEEGSGAGGQ